MDYSFLDKYKKEEEPAAEQNEQAEQVDYSFLDKYKKDKESAPADNDAKVREWLKSFYKGKQKAEDVPITPQLRERYGRQQNAPEIGPPKLNLLEQIVTTPIALAGGVVSGAGGETKLAGNILSRMAQTPGVGVPAYMARPEFKEGAAKLGEEISQAGADISADIGPENKDIKDVVVGTGEAIPGLAKYMTTGALGPANFAFWGGIEGAINAAESGDSEAAGMLRGLGEGALQDLVFRGAHKLLPNSLLGRMAASGAGFVGGDVAVESLRNGELTLPTPLEAAKKFATGAGVAGLTSIHGRPEPTSESLIREAQKKAVEVPTESKLEAPGPTVVRQGGSNLTTPKDTGLVEKSRPGASSQGISVEKPAETPIEPKRAGFDPREFLVKDFGGKQEKTNMAEKLKDVEQAEVHGAEGTGASIEAQSRGVRHVKFSGGKAEDFGLDVDTGLKRGEFDARIKLNEKTGRYEGEILNQNGVEADRANTDLSNYLERINADAKTAPVQRDWFAPKKDTVIEDINGKQKEVYAGEKLYTVDQGNGMVKVTDGTTFYAPAEEVARIKGEAPKPADMKAGETVVPPEQVPTPVETTPPVPPSGMTGKRFQTILDSFPKAYRNAKQAYLNWVNKAQGVENLSKFAEDNGLKLDSILDPKLAVSRKYGSVGMANSILMDGTFKTSADGVVTRTGEGLKQILGDFDKNSTITDKQFRIKRLDEFLQANRTVTDLGESGKATPQQVEAAKRKLNALEMTNPKEFANMKAASGRIYEFQKRTLEMMVESGVISQESYNNILSKNKAYVPFERILPEEIVSAGVTGKGKPAPRKVIFGMKGSEKEVKNTLESIVKKTYEMVDAANTNYVNRSVAQFEGVLPDLVKKIKHYPGRRAGKNEILVYEDGKASTYSVSPGIYQAMSGLDPKSSSLLMKLFMTPKRILQVGATATPDFAIRNLMRDQTGAMINTKIKFKPFVDTISAIADIAGKKDVFKEYMASGGGMQSYADLNRNALAKSLNHIRGNRSLLEKMNIVSHLGDFSSLLETATRLGVYKAAKRSGISAVGAGKISRESTLDFSRSGSSGEKVNRVIAFFNAGMQGVDRMARAAKADPVGFTAKTMAAVTIPEIIFQLLNKDDEEFKNSPRWRKDLFWHIPGLNAWVPKPFVVGQAFGSVPGRFMEYALTKDPHAFDNIANTMLEAFSPVGMDAIGAMMPTAIKPLAENVFNYSFFTQTNLYPSYKEKLPASERYSKYTGETWRELGKLLGMSPADLENIFRGYTAGLGQYATRVSDSLVRSMKGDEGNRPTELSDIPVIRGFVGRRASSVPERQNQFYRAYEEIDSAYAKRKLLADRGDDAAVDRLDAAHPELKYRTEFNKYRKLMSEYSKRIDEINKQKIPDAEKRAQLIEVEKERLKSLDEILSLYGGKVNLFNIPKTIRGIWE